MKRCPNGHYYDPTKHSSCPYCGIDIDLEFPKTQAKYGDSNKDNKILETLPNNPNRNYKGHTVGKNAESSKQESKTKGIYLKKLGMDPVVGWLVCIEGTDKGRDYRIRSGRNFIGRSESMDICINGDESISRLKHAVVIYEPKKRIFVIQPGDGRDMIYLNDDPVYTPMEIKNYDIIEMGQTKLMLIAFCGEKFKWD